MKKKSVLALGALFSAMTVVAQTSDVTMTVKDKVTTMSNGIVSVTIGSNGRASSMTVDGSSNLLGSSGIYFDYTASKNVGLSPSVVDIVKQTDDYAEVIYRNTGTGTHFEQGYIMRKGVSGVYTYVLAYGGSDKLNVREARVCVRTASTLLNGYVDDSMQGKIPSNSEMKTAEKTENTIQDATYKMADGSIYTKYNWANYVVNDSVHGLMNDKNGIWNIACSHEWLNGGPMRQELTVHATSKSPISIQMLQGEHFGASAMTLADGEVHLYGPFLIYANSGKSTEEMIADAKAQASEQMAQWPFEWFENEHYPLQRSTVTGQISMTGGRTAENVQVVLAAPGKELYRQTGGYMFWGKTDKDGYFSIPAVRKGDYSLYAYATEGDVTDELEVGGINVTDDETDLGTVVWDAPMYSTKLWQIGENNRMSDGFNGSDMLRQYGHWDIPEANINFVVGESDPAKDWYFAQTKNGSWTVTFNVDAVYEGDAVLTASVAGATSSPSVAVEVNGVRKTSWSFYNDAGVYRSAVLGGRHCVRTCTFPASDLKPGVNTVSLKYSGGNHAGVMWDCIKLEAGDRLTGAITDIDADYTSEPVEIYTVSGVKVGTFDSLESVTLDKGLYIYRQGSKSGKVLY